MPSGSLSTSRALSLRAPIANEEERALFQKRLALTSLTVALLAAGFWGVAGIATLVVRPGHFLHTLSSETQQLHFATTAMSFAFWLVTRRGKRSAIALDLLDAIWAVGICSGWALMILWESTTRGQRPELVAVLACAYTLVTRAALIPSTPARTGLIGILGMAPVIVVAIVIHTGGPLVREMPLVPAVYAGIWGGIGIAATKTISWVIYGLRLEVRKAMQLGQYLLEEKIGEGGMGAVYRASHAMLRRPTAIKLLSNANASSVERFEREVQLTARLTHPNTIAVFDYGRTPDGVFYYAMEYLDGTSLEDLVHAHGPQPPARVVHLLLQVCGALEEAHAAGLVHRDIKPANLMLTVRGGVPDVVKVLDFGLVKESIDAKSPSVTNASAILGTPHYMAPESILDPDTVDGRTDLYALGATAFFLLTGERVFEGANLVEVCSKHLHEDPPAPSSRQKDVPQSLDAIVLACLAKKPEHRPRDVVALAGLLRRAGVPEWTREDAARWWEEHRGVRASSTRAPAAQLAQTVTVALDDRVAS